MNEGKNKTKKYELEKYGNPHGVDISRIDRFSVGGNDETAYLCVGEKEDGTKEYYVLHARRKNPCFGDVFKEFSELVKKIHAREK